MYAHTNRNMVFYLNRLSCKMLLIRGDVRKMAYLRGVAKSGVVCHLPYGSFGTEISMGTFVFRFELLEAQCQVKLGLILKFKNFF